MKIAIICPVGDLRRFGYWRNAQACLESWQALGDLFLVHSSRADMPFSVWGSRIQDDDTLMQLRNNVEWFDHRLIAANANRGIAEAQRAGYDVGVTICVNWYIEADASKALAERASAMIRYGDAYKVMYRRLQMDDYLFDIDLESPAMLNLHIVKPDVVKVLADWVEIDGAQVNRKRGDYPAILNDSAYIDCEFEVTRAEFQEKMLDVRNYEDILPKRSGADWAFWEEYFARRARALRMSPDVIGKVGRKIALQHPLDSMSDFLLSKMAVSA